jgi:hypothetical protein
MGFKTLKQKVQKNCFKRSIKGSQGFKPRCNDAEQKAWARVPAARMS